MHRLCAVYAPEIARKRYTVEQVIAKLREAEIELALSLQIRLDKNDFLTSPDPMHPLRVR